MNLLSFPALFAWDNSYVRNPQCNIHALLPAMPGGYGHGARYVVQCLLTRFRAALIRRRFFQAATSVFTQAAPVARHFLYEISNEN